MKKIFISLILAFVMVVGMVTLNSSVSYAKNIIVTPNAEACPYYGSNHVFSETIEEGQISEFAYNHQHPMLDDEGNTIYKPCTVIKIVDYNTKQCACGRTKAFSYTSYEHYVGGPN